MIKNYTSFGTRHIATNGWVFVSVLPCTNVQIIDKVQWQNSTNTVLYAGRLIKAEY